MNWFSETFDTFQFDPDFIEEGIQLEFCEEMLRVMEAKDITLSDLASKVGYSEAILKKVLSGKVRLSVKLMSKIAASLRCKITIKLGD